MAYFYGTLRGGRAAVSRTGTKDSGIRSLVSGPHFGVVVNMWTTRDGEDMAEIKLTGGQVGDIMPEYLGTWRRIGSRLERID